MFEDNTNFDAQFKDIVQETDLADEIFCIAFYPWSRLVWSLFARCWQRSLKSMPACDL